MGLSSFSILHIYISDRFHVFSHFSSSPYHPHYVLVTSVCVMTSHHILLLLLPLLLLFSLYIFFLSKMKVHSNMKLLSHRQGSFISSWCCPTVLCKTFNLCVPTRSSEMKVEWTLHSAPIYKYRCRAWTISHVHSRSAPFST
jgi:hypothetical protein